MDIEERKVTNPNRRQVTELDTNGNEVRSFAADIETSDELEEVEQEGTPIDLELMKKINWRDDDSLSFKVRDDVPEPKGGETQIYTDSAGKTFLMSPGNEPIELGKTTGTTVTVGDVPKDTWDADKKVNVSDVKDSLTDNSTDKPLSAAQGKALNQQIDGLTNTKANQSGWIAGRSMITDINGNLSVGGVTAGELSYLTGVTSLVQTQLNAKLAGTKIGANSPNTFIGYNSEQNTAPTYVAGFKGNTDANGLCYITTDTLKSVLKPSQGLTAVYVGIDSDSTTRGNYGRLTYSTADVNTGTQSGTQAPARRIIEIYKYGTGTVIDITVIQTFSSAFGNRNVNWQFMLPSWCNVSGYWECEAFLSMGATMSTAGTEHPTSRFQVGSLFTAKNYTANASHVGTPTIGFRLRQYSTNAPSSFPYPVAWNI